MDRNDAVRLEAMFQQQGTDWERAIEKATSPRSSPISPTSPNIDLERQDGMKGTNDISSPSRRQSFPKSPSQVSWLPPLAFQTARTPSRTRVRYPLARHQSSATMSSTTTSQQSAFSASTAARLPSSQSSFSSHSRSSTMQSSPLSIVHLANNTHDIATRKEKIEASQKLRSGRTPPRPESQPGMPPSAFWRYASAHAAYTPTPAGAVRRHLCQYDERKREPSMCRYPLLPCSSKSTPNPSSRKSSHSTSDRRRSYKNMRKTPLGLGGDGLPLVYGSRKKLFARVQSVDSDIKSHRAHISRGSRTLVKQRQPREKGSKRASRARLERV